MILFYIAAGFAHFLIPEFYYKMMPSYLPFHYELNIIAGVTEIILGLLLIPKATRTKAAWGIILLLIAVFPANIQMSMNAYNSNDPKFILTLFRLPFQILFIAWAWLFTKNK
ncbi:DoxX family protein [Leptospira sarikeiensis]|uniref:DoxX family protein n=2 Tax=Leptospira sarikeiensis TaxID=2484943 RepID=A0A4R9KCS0_9LEPT|nr:DoxX family protein [Leptospira sarikeiensis]